MTVMDGCFRGVPVLPRFLRAAGVVVLLAGAGCTATLTSTLTIETAGAKVRATAEGMADDSG